MNSFPVYQVKIDCNKYGPLLLVEAPLSGANVMLAIAAVESGGEDINAVGHDCGPRYEPSYDVGGAIWKESRQQQLLVEQYGKLGASSFGPWQMMLINCTGYTPDELQKDLDGCARAFVSYFNSYVIHGKHAKTLSDIGQVWNAGHVHPADAIPAGVQRYLAALTHAYTAASLPTKAEEIRK